MSALAALLPVAAAVPRAVARSTSARQPREDRPAVAAPGVAVALCEQPADPPASQGLDPDRISDRAHVRPEACPRPVRLAAHHVEAQTGEIIAQLAPLRIPCDCWSCPVCGPAKRRRLVGHYAAALGPVSHLHLATLTLDPSSGVTPEESRKYIVHLWSLWRKRLNRLAVKAGNPSGVLFVAACEPQKTTHLYHVHALVSLPGIAPDAAAAAWKSIGGGIVCDVQPISHARAHGADDDGPRGSAARSVGYILKYALKEATERHTPGRRYLLATQGLGYYSAPARARRRAHVEAETGRTLPPVGEPRAVAGTGYVEILTPSSTRPKGLAPDAITAEDRERFALLRASSQRTSYRYLDKKTGFWWRIRQDGEQRSRRRIPPPLRWRPPV